MEFIRRNKQEIAYILIFFILFVILIFFKRSVFLSTYDAEYWKDRYEHSRYSIPISDRGIGDDELYAYGGYAAVNGVDPVKIVFDKPALGIFIIGVFIKVFNNSAIYGIVVGFGLIVSFYLLSKRLFKNKKLAFISTAIILFSPIMFSHFYVTLLDTLQLLFLFLNLIFFYDSVILKKNKKAFILVSALMLGLLSQIKIPYFLPVILLMELGLLIFQKQFRLVSFYLLGLLMSLFTSYFIYFTYGYNIIDFFRIQKYILNFYLSSRLEAHYEALWKFIGTGFFPDVVSRVPLKIDEWSYVLLFFTIFGVIFSTLAIFSKLEIYWKGIAIYILSSLIFFTIIPFYPRYILMVYPFIVIITIKYFYNYLPKKVFNFFIIIICLYLIMNSLIFLNSTPQYNLNKFESNFGNLYFQDLYQESLVFSDQLLMNRDVFYSKIFNLMQDAKVHSVEIVEINNNISRFDKEGSILAKFTYNTYFLGPIVEYKEIKLKKVNNEWKIVWDWNFIFNGYKPEYSIQTERQLGKRGSITSSKSEILVEDGMGLLVEFNPTQMDSRQEKEMLNFLSKIGMKGPLDIQNAYLENVPYDIYIPLVSVFKKLSDKELNYLNSFKGIRLKENPTRIYNFIPAISSIENTTFNECCTHIYSSYNYHGRRSENNLEYLYDKQLSGYDGGSVTIVDNSNKIIKVVTSKQRKDGQDIKL